MICGECGTMAADEAQFCSHCGHKLDGPEVDPDDGREMTRPKAGRVFRGVAAGMAQYFGGDVKWFRVWWVVLSIVTFGLLVVAYAALSFAIPEEK